MSDPIADEAAIEIVDLRFSYPDGHVAVDGISFAVRAGESAALMGANGVGKSTLLLCIVGVNKGDGLIRVQGVELKPETVQQIRRRIGFVFQNPEHQLFSTSVIEDVVFGPLNLGLPKEEALKCAREILDKLGLSGLHERAPQRLLVGALHSGYR